MSKRYWRDKKEKMKEQERNLPKDEDYDPSEFEESEN
jgi:hypothetical protein